MASEVNRQSPETPGYKAFQEHYSILLAGIQAPADLAGKLFSKDMITDAILIQVVNSKLDKRAQSTELLVAVMSKLSSDSNSFGVFVAALEEEPTLRVIADRMRESYRRHESLQPVQPADSPEGKSHFQYLIKLSEQIPLKDYRCWLVIFIGGLLLAFLGHQYVTEDLRNRSEVPSISPLLNTTHNCTELEKLSIRHASDQIAPNNLPYVRGHFVGRDSELQEISHLLIHSTHSGVAMVNIYGSPAVGKSTLAITVGHQLARHGIVVRYVNVIEAHNLFVEISETVNGEPPSSTHSCTTSTNSQSTTIASHSTGGALAIPWYSYAEQNYVLTSPQKLMEWAKGLPNDTLLILDNCDDLLQRNKTYESKFKEILRALLEASDYLRIVLTSRAQMLLVGGFRPFLLKELDPTSAVHLLQLESNLISREEGKVIAELVGYNPLGLGIVAGLVNEKISPLYSIIENLKQQLIETLSQAKLPKTQQMSKVLEFSYNYLHGEIQVCSRYLSNFPGSFHRDAALNILGMCNFSDPEHCLTALARRSFLEAYWHADQPRYQFPRLIREFLLYIQYRDRNLIKNTFIFYYQRYYSQSIASLSQLYSSNPYSSEIISSLECDTHNYLRILQMMIKLQLEPKSVFNIAYGISNGTNFFLKILPHKETLAQLFRVLIRLFDQEIFTFSQEIGINEITVLYFNLISIVKEWLVKSHMSGSPICMALCKETFVNHHSRVEKLSTTDSNKLNAYYYHPLTCFLDCFKLEMLMYIDVDVIVDDIVGVIYQIALITVLVMVYCYFSRSFPTVYKLMIIVAVTSLRYDTFTSSPIVVVKVVIVVLLFSMLISHDQINCLCFQLMAFTLLWYPMIRVILPINVYLYYSLVAFPHCVFCVHSVANGWRQI